MQFRFGTCDVTQSNAAVTINGVTAGATGVAIGQSFKTDRDGDAIYQIASRTPASGPTLTALTLTVPYGGASGAGLLYQICSDFSVNRGYPLPQQGDADAADWISLALTKIDQDIASIIGQGGGVVLSEGQIAFWHQGIIGDNAFSYDEENTRFGLGTQTPSYKIHALVGNSGNDGLLIGGSAGINVMLSINDGVASTSLQSINGAPSLATSAATLVFYETSLHRMKLDSGRLLIGASGMIGGGAVAGEIVLENSKALTALDGVGTTAVALITLDSSDRVVLSPDGHDIFWGTTMIALGGGAIATLGQVGGSGPGNTAQAGWLKAVDNAGVFYIPIWR